MPAFVYSNNVPTQALAYAGAGIVGTTVPFNLMSRIPVISVPTGFARSGVPTGVQIAGRPYDDREVFRIAKAFEHKRPWLDNPQSRPALEV